MPDCCNNCEFHWEEDVSFEIMHQCQIKAGYIDDADIHSFPYDCPLVEIPPKHGRLIDADALMDIFADRLVKVSVRYGIDSAVAGAVCGAMKLLDVQPAVIDTEGEG